MQEIIQGEGSFHKVPSLLKAKGHDHVFLVAGHHFFKENDLGFLAGMKYERWVKSGTNVTSEEILDAFTAYKKQSPPVLLAIGGGSVIDLAKSIIYECIQSSVPIPFFIAVPTTAGSGSEATHFAVIYKENKKLSLVHPSLLPVLTVLDSQLTYALPAASTAASGMDALAQAVESTWNIHATTASKEYATEAISIWKQYFLAVVTHPSPVERERMLWASHLAGKAINITRTTGPHALSYFLTSTYQVLHGQAVAIFLPVFFMYNKPQAALCNLLGVKDETAAMHYIQSMMKQAGMAINFADLGLDKNKIMDDLLASVNQERFGNNPRPFDREELKELFYEYL